MPQSIKIISSMATRPILAALADLYAQRTGYATEVKSMGGVDAARMVRAGTDADVVILASNAMEKLEAENLIVAGSRRDFARSDIAIAVRSGAERPAIDDEHAVKRAILECGKFCFSTGPSGDHLKHLLNRWGIADATAQRAIQAPAGVPVGELLAQGDADLGFQQMSELLGCPGIDILGPLPPAIQATTVFAAGISATSSKPNDASALIAFLVSPETEITKRQHGMDAPRA